MDILQARHNMVEKQVRPWEVLDQQVLDTLAQVPRERFVPQQYQSLAFADINIPLGHDQVMLRPNVEGRMLQALGISATDTALAIGTGSGFISACIAQQAQQLDSVDIFPEFTANARKVLTDLKFTNIQLITADAMHAWQPQQQYDVIAITGSVPAVPEHYKTALSPNGRLFVIVGAQHQPTMQAWIITRVSEQQWMQESVFETVIPPLLNINQPSQFVL